MWHRSRLVQQAHGCGGRQIRRNSSWAERSESRTHCLKDCPSFEELWVASLVSSRALSFFWSSLLHDRSHPGIVSYFQLLAFKVQGTDSHDFAGRPGLATQT